MCIRGGVMAKMTKRPLNRCRQCGYTWYPRGKSVSARCPRCGSAKTSACWLSMCCPCFALILVGAGAIAVAIVGTLALVLP